MTKWEGTNDGISVRIKIENGVETTYGTDCVLVAGSREPVIDMLEPDKIGLKLAADGFYPTDDRPQTNRGHVFAVSNIASKLMLIHKAITKVGLAIEMGCAP